MSEEPFDDLELGATLRGFAAGQTLFGRFRLVRTIGRGGMGVVWLAQDEQLEREVALKFLPEMLVSDRTALEDLKRETRRSLSLTHHHIVRIFDFHQQGNVAGISMEYVDGDTLSNVRVEHGVRTFNPGQLGATVKQLCEALDYAHGRAKIVHRDLKPANLMVNRAGDLKVTDFGISASITESASRVSMRPTGGTLVYMSPQQLMGEEPCVADDIYSLGATLYDLITGKPPFYQGNIDLQVREKVPPPMAERREALGNTGEPIPQVWEETIAACLAKDPAARPQSAVEVRERLSGTRQVIKPVPQAVASVVATPVTVTPAPVPEIPKRVAVQVPRIAQPAMQKPGGKGMLIATLVVLLLAGGAAGWWLVSATKEKPFVNSLGMKFMPVPVTGGPTNGKRVLFGVWDVRVKDYRVFAEETKREWEKPDFAQNEEHPVVMVSWDDAKAFCAWLTKRDRDAGKLGVNEEYRLPSDHEWSCAVGIGDREDATASPKDKDGKIDHVFPWGTQWPPPKGAGNYGSINGYDDGYANTSPVGSFSANQYGLYDMSGNVWQWCEDFWESGSNRDRVLRGGSWGVGGELGLRSSSRNYARPTFRVVIFGFRCVLVVSGG